VPRRGKGATTLKLSDSTQSALFCEILMSAYNTVIIDLGCKCCGSVSTRTVQFKFGNARQLEYRVGDVLAWGGNDIGVAGQLSVVVDGVVEGSCRSCGLDKEWSVYVQLERDRIVRVVSATGEHDFVAARNHFIVLAR
jgi:hypothetical protein